MFSLGLYCFDIPGAPTERERTVGIVTIHPPQYFSKMSLILCLLNLFIQHSSSATRTQLKKYSFETSRGLLHFLIQLCNHFPVHTLASIIQSIYHPIYHPIYHLSSLPLSSNFKRNLHRALSKINVLLTSYTS